MGKAKLICDKCHSEFNLQEMYRCPYDGGELTFTYDYEGLKNDNEFKDAFFGRNYMWNSFFDILPLKSKKNIVTLGEGGTPLVKAERLANHLGIKNLYLKLEYCNPTGSFKDRQVSLALSNGQEWGRTRYCTVSSGNVGNSLAAYCARRGFKSNVWVADNTAKTKYQQINIYGGKLFLYPNPEENGIAYHEHFFYGLTDFCKKNSLVPVISARGVNPFTVEACKTISFEIFRELRYVPNLIAVPVGGGGLFSGMWKGFKELKKLGFTNSLPQMCAGQLQGHYVPITEIENSDYDKKNLALPLDGVWANKSMNESKGFYAPFEEKKADEAQKILSTTEGIFAEPQGIHGLAGLIYMIEHDKIKNIENVVCIISGNGLKDMAKAEQLMCDKIYYKEIDRVKSFDESFICGLN